MVVAGGGGGCLRPIHADEIRIVSKRAKGSQIGINKLVSTREDPSCTQMLLRNQTARDFIQRAYITSVRVGVAGRATT